MRRNGRLVDEGSAVLYAGLPFSRPSFDLGDLDQVGCFYVQQGETTCCDQVGTEKMSLFHLHFLASMKNNSLFQP